MRSRKKSMQGISLIEILVTTVVLALGILGTSALQITGIKGTDAAHYRTVATFLANEAADRIRANPEGMLSGDYATPDTPISCYPIAESTVDCNASACTPSQLAVFDLTELTCGHVRKTGTSWRSASKGGVVNSLPGGRLVIGCGTSGCGGNKDHTIVVSWTDREDKAGSNGVNTSVSLTITP